MSPWSKETSDSYIGLGKQSHVDLLVPEIRSIMPPLEGRAVLDFGCGDGRLAHALLEDSPRSILCVDESMEMIREARRVLSAKRCDSSIRYVCGDESLLPTREKFDCILCSLVLMMEEKRERLDAAVRGLIASLAHDGSLLLILTHPCFPRGKHSDFRLKYSKSFNYWSSSAPVTVVLSPPGKESIEIIDYHWTLEDYFLAVEKGGGQVLRLREYPAKYDRKTGSPDTAPAYLLIQISRPRGGEKFV